eukprot:GHVL01016620.1.p1 GENE.GHVL01016620.1~~GHVL01016620.1.p1  ORF type:complete len:154 (+),score=5.37 GHVL01016620.1:426-887(+)
MVQRNRLTFKRAIVRIGGYMSNHTLDQEASEMLLLSKPRPQLTDSKEFHWASQRCIAAESLVTLVNALKGVSSRIKLLIPSNKCTYIDDWIEDWEKIVPEARNLIFEALAVDILDLKVLAQNNIIYISNNIIDICRVLLKLLWLRSGKTWIFH